MEAGALAGVGFGLDALSKVGGMGYGIYQLIKANKLSKTERPEWEITQSDKDSLGLAKSLASQRELAGQSIIEDKMRSSTAAGTDAITDVSGGGDAMGALVDLFGKEQYGLADLGIEAERQYFGKQQNLQRALDKMGVLEQQKNQWEKYDPYTETMREASMMREGGLQNIMGGFQGLGNTFMDAASYKNFGGEFSNPFDGMFSGWGKPNNGGIYTPPIDVLNKRMSDAING
jgi:hypothetical protein